MINKNYRWYVLILAALTDMVAVAAPSMGLSVLLPEISQELHLSLVQVGLVWGISGLPAIVSGLFGGVISDRIGPKRVLILSCILIGLAGALRGIAGNYQSLMFFVFLFGFLGPIIVMSNVKTTGDWFSHQELGFANGALAMGMAAGFLVGSMVSASVLSPMLGGWRNVFILYGVVSILFAVPWYLSRSAPVELSRAKNNSSGKAILAGLSQVMSLKNLWLLGLGVLGISGSIQGLLGYLPLHLRSVGWAGGSADGTLGAFHSVSMLAVLPIALWSDRLGSRRSMLITMGIFITTGVGLLSIVQGSAVWIAVILAGVVRDGFMAIFMTAVIETRGVGISTMGTATGFTMIFIGLGNLLAPPLGNSLAEIAPGAPFIFWSALSVLGIFSIALTKKVEKVSLVEAR